MKNIALKQLNEHTPSTDEYIKAALCGMIKSSSKKAKKVDKVVVKKGSKKSNFPPKK
ncbi:MAG: hypothetical protein KGQ36_02070 [Rickettsiales bacterium]|nr:hypothetical protein [Rickettsiales bacterium]